MPWRPRTEWQGKGVRDVVPASKVGQEQIRSWVLVPRHIQARICKIWRSAIISDVPACQVCNVAPPFSTSCTTFEPFGLSPRSILWSHSLHPGQISEGPVPSCLPGCTHVIRVRPNEWTALRIWRRKSAKPKDSNGSKLIVLLVWCVADLYWRAYQGFEVLTEP